MCEHIEKIRHGQVYFDKVLQRLKFFPVLMIEKIFPSNKLFYDGLTNSCGFIIKMLLLFSDEKFLTK